MVVESRDRAGAAPPMEKGEEKHLWDPSIMHPSPQYPALLWIDCQDHFPTATQDGHGQPRAGAE